MRYHLPSYRTATGLFLAVLWVCSSAAEGDLDPAFDDNGVAGWRVETSANGFTDACLDVDALGRPVLAGVAIGSPLSEKDGLLLRYRSDGSRDPDFGDDGEVFIDVDHKLATLNEVRHQEDGRILVLGTKNLGIGLHAVFIARFLVDGSPDESFGDGGRRIFNLGNNKRNYGDAMTLDAAGRIYLALGHYHSRRSFSAVARLAQDGSLDPSFGGGDGWMEVQRDGYRFQYPEDIIIDSNGGIVVLTKFNGYENTYRSLEAFRLNEVGEIDDSFGEQGYCTWISAAERSCEMTTIVELAGGDYLLGGHCSGGDLRYREIGLWRISARGALVDSFGADGYASIPYQPHEIDGNLAVADFVVLNETQLLVAGGHDIDSGRAGSRFSAQSSWISRVLVANGAVDSGFGESGFSLLGAETTINDIGAADLVTPGDTRSLQQVGGLRLTGDRRHAYVGGFGYVDNDGRASVARVVLADLPEPPGRRISIDVDGVTGVQARLDEESYEDVPALFDTTGTDDHLIGFQQTGLSNG